MTCVHTALWITMGFPGSCAAPEMVFSIARDITLVTVTTQQSTFFYSLQNKKTNFCFYKRLSSQWWLLVNYFYFIILTLTEDCNMFPNYRFCLFQIKKLCTPTCCFYSVHQTLTFIQSSQLNASSVLYCFVWHTMNWSKSLNIVLLFYLILI